MKYDDRYVLKGIDLEAYRGQIIGYIGPNGAGKSTTVKIMLGLVEGYTGTVEIFGHNIADGRVDYKRRIGYVPEVAEIYDNLTASEYLTFIGELYGLPADRADRKARRLMTAFDLGHAYDARISSFSKGMRQKVLLISSLLHNPDLLFLDEPLSGLDANSVIVVKEILARLSARGKTIFYSSHIMEVVEKIKPSHHSAGRRPDCGGRNVRRAEGTVQGRHAGGHLQRVDRLSRTRANRRRFRFHCGRGLIA
jgi:ABC-2 type transport system ATP-binding protein